MLAPRQYRRCLSASLVALFILGTTADAAEPPPAGAVSWWHLDGRDDDGVIDAARDVRDPVRGPVEFVPGVRGKAVKLDGFRSHIRRETHPAGDVLDGFTVEGWVALAAYPWSWAPVVDCSSPALRGFFLGIGPHGHPRFRIAAGRDWQTLTGAAPVPLRRWVHLAAVFQPDDRVFLLVDGEEVAAAPVSGNFIPGRRATLTLGAGNVPTTWHEFQYTTEDARFFLDGLLDEVGITAGAKSAAAIRRGIEAMGEPPPPALSDRSRLPKGPAGGFGAFHTRLDYYPEWDAMWRVGEVPDIFVRFDDSPVQLVFWRGTSFVPCWVTENDIWYNNEWLETWGADVSTCAEPIMDRHCRYSHVRLIENTDARVVVHWRYALNDADYKIAAVGDDGRGEWADEYHIIYPDQVGVRVIHLHYSKPERKHDWVEQIVVLPPGRRPDDVIERDALSLINMDGRVKAYSWHEGFDMIMTEPAGANISSVHLKAENRPFLIVPPGPVETVEGSWEAPFFRSYASSMALGYSPSPPPSVYGWWNHWPVAQIPGDGRWVVTPDRPSHFSLTTFVQWQDHEVTPKTRTRLMLQGMTAHEPADLVHLAKSWVQAPVLEVASDAFLGRGYDPAERAYVLEKKRGGEAGSFTASIAASEESPLLNPAFIIRNWGDGSATLRVNGGAVPSGSAFRQGIRHGADGRDLILWVEMDARQPVTLEVGRG